MVGPGDEERTATSPLITRASRDRVVSFVDDAAGGGATAAVDGSGLTASRFVPGEVGIPLDTAQDRDHALDHATYTDAHKRIADSGWWELEDRTDRRRLFTSTVRPGHTGMRSSTPAIRPSCTW